MSGEREVSRELAAFARDLRFEDLPGDVVESVAMRVLDTVGIVVGASGLPTSSQARAWAGGQGSTGPSTAVAVLGGLPPHLAAFVNGVAAHSLDYDDTHLPSVLHPSASVVPAALAAAEATGASGADVVRAIALGLETTVRLGMAGYDEGAGNSIFFENGQHATSICGAIGSAVAVASLRDRDSILDAMGIAASMAAGIIESNRTGGTVKRIHCGWAAHSAIVAADLAALGVSGPPTVLEGRFGFLRAWLHDTSGADSIVEGLGREWSVPGIFFKPYPANHFTHAAIDAGAALRRAGVGPDDIVRLTLGVPAPTLRTIGEPIEVKRRPETGYMAQFSGPYALVAGLLGGGGLEVAIEDFSDEKALDPRRRELMSRVDVVADDRCTAIFPHQFPAIVTARLADGRTVVEEVLSNRGGPERPLSFDELSAKFTDNVADRLDAAATDALVRGIRTLDRQRDLRGLLAPLASVRTADTPTASAR